MLASSDGSGAQGGTLSGEVAEIGAPRNAESTRSPCVLSKSTRGEIVLQAKLAGPVALTVLLQVLVDMITLVIVGHLGPVQLAATALGNFYCNSTGFAITSGMTSAVDTLSSQAFGARNFRRIGVVAQRAVAVLGTLALAQSLLWLRADWILSHLGQDAEVVALATRFVAVRVPELWAVVLFEVIKRSLQAQGIVRPPLAATALTIPLHIALSYTLTYHTSLGFWGAAVASICTRLLQAAGMLVYVLWRGDALTVVTVGHIARMAAEQEREAPPLDLAGQDASARGQYAP
ncbi:DTX16, partial [Symbiodinium sp. KB8]